MFFPYIAYLSFLGIWGLSRFPKAIYILTCMIIQKIDIHLVCTWPCQMPNGYTNIMEFHMLLVAPPYIVSHNRHSCKTRSHYQNERTERKIKRAINLIEWWLCGYHSKQPNYWLWSYPQKV
jgi:hypothetical protein